MTHLTRIALDRVVGGYVGVVPAAAQGKAMRNIPMIGTAEVERRLASEDANWTLLDVRDADEIGRAHVCTPVTNAHLVCRLLLANKKTHMISKYERKGVEK